MMIGLKGGRGGLDTFDRLRQEHIVRHTFNPSVKVLNVTDYVWQVLQYHPPLGVRKIFV